MSHWCELKGLPPMQRRLSPSRHLGWTATARARSWGPQDPYGGLLVAPPPPARDRAGRRRAAGAAWVACGVDPEDPRGLRRTSRAHPAPLSLASVRPAHLPRVPWSRVRGAPPRPSGPLPWGSRAARTSAARGRRQETAPEVLGSRAAAARLAGTWGTTAIVQAWPTRESAGGCHQTVARMVRNPPGVLLARVVLASLPQATRRSCWFFGL